MMRIGLVACASLKLDRPAPARELYLSPLFCKASAFCAANYDAWYVLSALHGLVSPDALTQPYDLALHHLSRRDRREWAERVTAQMEAAHPSFATWFYHAGRLYREGLPFGRAPLEGLAIGQQLAWYRERGY